MKRLSGQPRRPNLATIVGSGLALVAAGSLLAFSSLAEQAGLQGLSTGGVRPASPERIEPPEAITVPAPATAPPAEPRDPVDELLRRVVEPEEPAPEPALPVVVVPPEPPDRPRVRRTENRSVAGPDTGDEAATRKRHGPPYGHAYGYHKDRGERAEPPPAQARTANGGAEKSAKPPKAEKVQKAKPGKAKGHSKHARGNSHGKGKAKGHSKHGH